MILNFFGILLWPRYWNGSESEWNTSPSFIMKHLWIKNAKNPVKKETWKSKQSALDGAKRTQIHSSPFDVPVFQVVHWVLVAHPIWHLYLISLAYTGHKSLAHYHHFLKNHLIFGCDCQSLPWQSAYHVTAILSTLCNYKDCGTLECTTWSVVLGTLLQHFKWSKLVLILSGLNYMVK